MSVFQAVLIAGLVLIAVLHTMSRAGGALATVAWCVGATVYGAQNFGPDPALGHKFIGIQTPQWVFYVAMIGVALYNIAIIIKALRRRPKPKPAQS